MATCKASFTNVDEYLFEHRDHSYALTSTKKDKNILESKQLTKDYILDSYTVDLRCINNSSDRTQKLIIRSLIKATIYNLDGKYLKYILKFRVKNIIPAILASLFGNDLLLRNKHQNITDT